MNKNDFVQVSFDDNLEIGEGHIKYLGKIGTVLKIQKNMYYDENDDVAIGPYALVQMKNAEQDRSDNIIFETKNLRSANLQD